MPQLGLGLGLNKGSYIKPLPKWLTDAGCTFAINVDRQVKALANPNSPFINPLVDVVGKLGKNLFDPIVLSRMVQTVTRGSASFQNNVITVVASSADCFTEMVYTSGQVTASQRIMTIPVKPNTQYAYSRTISLSSGGTNEFISYYDENFNTLSFASIGQTVNGRRTNIITTPANTKYISVRLGATVIGTVTYTDFQLEEGTVATTYEPYGFNNVLLQSFAGTTADGYTQIALPNGKNPWFLNSDGTDSYMIGVNNADTDILGTVNFGLGFYTRTNGTLVNSWLISKAESSEATTQYGVKITSAGALQLFLNGASITLATGLAINTPYKIVIVREAGTLKCEVNDVETYSAANSTNITTRPNLRLGARSSNVGGTTHTEFYNGYFGAFDLSQGSLCTLASFKKSFAKLIGGTYV